MAPGSEATTSRGTPSAARAAPPPPTRAPPSPPSSRSPPCHPGSRPWSSRGQPRSTTGSASRTRSGSHRSSWSLRSILARGPSGCW
uniref:Uncharacterized protein n=1 Tax=Arundo donax TaxID=35708 RepID=A0A0A9DW98_ARUDO